MDVELTVYLSGDIDSDWREALQDAVDELDLPVDFTGPVTDRAAVDECGAAILGPEQVPFWRDHKAAKLNMIRTRTLIGEADLVVVRFGEDGAMVDAAFEAGYAAALGTPTVVLHPRTLGPALKAVDAEAMAVCETPEQVVAVLRYLTRGEVSRPGPTLSLVR